MISLRPSRISDSQSALNSFTLFTTCRIPAPWPCPNYLACNSKVQDFEQGIIELYHVLQGLVAWEVTTSKYLRHSSRHEAQSPIAFSVPTCGYPKLLGCLQPVKDFLKEARCSTFQLLGDSSQFSHQALFRARVIRRRRAGWIYFASNCRTAANFNAQLPKHHGFNEQLRWPVDTSPSR